MSNIAQYIIVRDDLKMPAGKIASQAAHASISVFLNRGHFEYNPKGAIGKANFIVDVDTAMEEWITKDFTKIVLVGKSESQLIDLYDHAKLKGYPCSMIRDNGQTVFDGRITLTAVAIGPIDKETVKYLVGDLRLL